MNVAVVIAVIASLCCVYAAEVKKQTNDDDLFYVFGSRECVSSDKDSLCSVNYKIPSYYKVLSSFIRTNSSILGGLKYAGKNCSDAVISLTCSAMTPRCLEADNMLDFGDVNATCQKLYDSCPKSLNDVYNGQNLCGNYISGKYARKCVSPPEEIEGSCPPPKYKMPPNLLAQYTITSKRIGAGLESMKNLTNSNGTLIFSPGCLVDYKKMACTEMYCSNDGERILVKTSKQDCSKLLQKCFFNFLNDDEVSKSLRQMLYEVCDHYPDESSKKESIKNNSKEVHYVSKSLFASILVFLFVKNVAL